MKGSLKSVLACAMLALLWAGSASAQQLLINGNFETGDLSGWTLVDSGSGTIQAYTGTTSPISGFAVLAPPDGTYAAISDQTGPGSHILYQDVSVPADASAVVFSAVIYYENRATDFFDNGTLSEIGDPNQQMRVDIMDPAAPVDDVGAGVLDNVFITEPGDPLSLGYTQITASLTPYAGQTVRVRFAEVDNQTFFQAAIDVASVQVMNPAIVPVNSRWALAVFTGLVLLLAGVAFARRARSG